MPRKTKDQRRRDRKRKQERRQSERRQGTIQPYTGGKYRTDELALVHFAIESAIHWADLAGKRRLTDHQVRQMLADMALQVRKGLGIAPPVGPEPNPSNSSLETLLDWSIRCAWQRYLTRYPHPGQDNLVGVLRSLLASVDVYGSIAPRSRGYLEFIEDFLHGGDDPAEDSVALAEYDLPPGIVAVGGWDNDEEFNDDFDREPDRPRRR